MDVQQIELDGMTRRIKEKEGRAMTTERTPSEVAANEYGKLQKIIDGWSLHSLRFIKAMNEAYAEQTAELEQLRAIVDKLPKTIDGVPVVPGMRIYYPLRGQRRGEIEECWIDSNLHIVYYEPQTAGRYCWYSTREAANMVGKSKEI